MRQALTYGFLLFIRPNSIWGLLLVPIVFGVLFPQDLTPEDKSGELFN